MEKTEIISKISLAGESMVGKTSLIRRFVLEQFDDKYLMTLGTKVSKKTLGITDPRRGKVDMTLMIWDIIGLKGYHDKLHQAHFKGAKGALLVCDMTRTETLECLGRWAEEIQKVSGKIPLIFLANKMDLPNEFPEDEFEALARSYDTECFYTSAKTGKNVQHAFECLSRKMLDEMK